MKPKLTKAQREVLKRIAEGRSLWMETDVALRRYYFGDRELSVKVPTGEILASNGLIFFTSTPQFWKSKCELTDLGRAAIKDKP